MNDSVCQQMPTVEAILHQLELNALTLQKLELNALTRGNRCGVLTDDQLNEWLDGANITRHPNDFVGFEILFGFDRHAQDFVVIKNKHRTASTSH